MFRWYKLFHTTPVKGEKYIWETHKTNPFEREKYIVTVEKVKDDWIDVLDFYGHHDYYDLNNFFFLYKKIK
jgi:hypothetical protein